MRRWPLALVLTIAMPCLAASDVYRWIDANGVVHFSDAPPPQGTAYKLMDMQTGVSRDPASTAASSAESASATDTAFDSAQPAAADEPATVKDTPENRATLCSTLQKNIALLSSDQLLTASADSTEPLSADDRASRLARAQAQVKQYCTK